MSTYSTILNISYGANALQFVNWYQPTGTAKGTIMRIHGGAWSAVNGSVGPSSTATDSTMIQFVTAGYAVVDVQYRDRGVGNGGGTYVTGHTPGDVDDIVTVLGRCLDSATATAAGGNWPTIQSYIASNGGLVVGGVSAGGHLTIMGVCTYGTASNKWPLAAISIAGPLNIDYFNPDTNYIDPFIKIRKKDWMAQFGGGVEFFNEFFKLGLEIKYSQGLQNVLVQDMSPVSKPINSLYNNSWIFTVTFEGGK